MNKKTVRDIDVKGKRVLVRVDFNVPLDDKGNITDDTRIQAAVPTINYLCEQGAKVILCSHLGRPKGKPKADMSLKPVAAYLAKLIGAPVAMAPDCVGPEVAKMAASLKAGDVLLLENLRFHAEEEDNDPDFAKELASLADVFVNDAFGTAHRAHASTEGVTHYLPAVAGFLMEKEIDFLGTALESPKRPLVAILGGAKVSDKIAVIERLLSLADKLLIGGGMANTFLKAKGLEMGDSLVEADKLDMAKDLLAKGGAKLVLPVDAVIADKFAADATTKVVSVDAVPAGWRILDIGPRDSGPVQGNSLHGQDGGVEWAHGRFEFAALCQGHLCVAEALAELKNATTIIGGGDSAAAVAQAGLDDKMTHISTGGGASLEFLEGRELPGVVALNDK